MKKPLNYHWQR